LFFTFGRTATVWSTSDFHVFFFQDAYRLQLKIFLTDVRQQQRGQQIRSYLKLYTTISVSKLASFVGIDEATVRSAAVFPSLQSFEDIDKTFVFPSGIALEGSLIDLHPLSCSKLDDEGTVRSLAGNLATVSERCMADSDFCFAACILCWER
jgi:hypothetical protein